MALKFETGAFTTAPVYLESGPPLIASGGGGTPLTEFDGTYTGTYSGNGASGSVTATVANGTLTVTNPGSGSGSVAANGQVTFGVDITSGVSCNFTGTISLLGASATGSGTFSCPSRSITGTWSVTRQ